MYLLELKLDDVVYKSVICKDYESLVKELSNYLVRKNKDTTGYYSFSLYKLDHPSLNLKHAALHDADQLNMNRERY